MSKPTGSNAMKANGKVQISSYFFADEVKKIDRIAAKNRVKRAALVRNLVLNALKDVK